MKNKALVNEFLALALLASLGAPAAAAVRAETRSRIQGIQAAVKEAGADWVAGETEVSEADDAMLTGFDPQPPVGPEAPDPATRTLPRTLDWRDFGGKNFVTAPKSQAKCGSCWAFAMTGALEAYVLRTKNIPGTDLDLSEQVLLSCSGAGTCKGGKLYPEFIKDKGLPAETAYPYAAQNGACSAAAAGWQAGAYKIADWGIIWGGSGDRLKRALAAYGPLTTSMLVFEDFKHYKSGVYSHVSGKYLGGHAVLLVGYNDDKQYFIVKNSWGTKWGEEGFFRISYSQMKSLVFFGGVYSVAYYAGSGGKSAGEIPVRGFLQAEGFLK
ncbi:MAG TPA: C1 family peptidase [Elusimicrobiales bacterium]|nr:C1 family peptidase [Elusimicrobiales bacterium]